VKDKKDAAVFCPFCGKGYTGDFNICPKCGQNLKPYKDDLNPILNKIQDATNIDMKSTGAKIATTVIVFLAVFTTCFALISVIDNMPEPVPEGYVINVTNGYIALDGDFATDAMSVTPLYEPDLKLKIELNQSMTSKFSKIVWVLKTDEYNVSGDKNPFYLTVTKEKSKDTSMGSVTWGSVRVGGFTITASCYSGSGLTEIYEGYGTYHGRLSYESVWTYEGIENRMEITMTSEAVDECLAYDVNDRMNKQKTSDMTAFITNDSTISNLNSKLRSTFSKNYEYTDSKYADYVLSFISSCFKNEYDSFLYGVQDYWAYPSETVFKGCGDDEDRAILFSSLMKAAGFKTGLLVLPDRTVSAAIIVTDSKELGYTPLYVKKGSESYLVADADSGGIGLLGAGYSTESGKSIIYNGMNVTPLCHLITC